MKWTFCVSIKVGFQLSIPIQLYYSARFVLLSLLSFYYTGNFASWFVFFLTYFTFTTWLLCTTFCFFFSSFAILYSFTIYYLFFRNQIELFRASHRACSFPHPGEKTFVVCHFVFVSLHDSTNHHYYRVKRRTIISLSACLAGHSSHQFSVWKSKSSLRWWWPGVWTTSFKILGHFFFLRFGKKGFTSIDKCVWYVGGIMI